MDNDIICSIKTKDLYGKDKVLFFSHYWTGKEVECFFYCPECKTLEPIIIDHRVKNYTASANYFNYEGSIFCSTCNTEYNSKDYAILCYHGCSSSYIRCITVFDNKDNTISLKVGMNVIITTKKGLRILFAKQRLKINIEKGISYMLEPWINNKRAFFYKGPQIYNCSYGVGISYLYDSLPTKVLSSISNFIYNKKKELLGYNIPTLEEYNSNWIAKKKLDNSCISEYDDIKLQNILMYNRIPNLNPFNMHSLVSEKSLRKYNAKLNRSISKIKTYSNNPLKELMEVLNLPYTKSLRKIANNNYRSLYTISFFNDILDNLKYSINLEKKYDNLFFYGGSNLKYVLKFIKAILKKRGLKKTYIFLNNIEFRHGSVWILIDTSEMYHKILKYNKNHKRKIKIDLTGNLQKIHDDLSSILNKLATKKIYFKYPEKDKRKINYKEKGYEIKLTTNTHQLKDIGSYMNICVGSYDKRVLNHDCRIAILTKDKKYITCIELDYELKKILQTKMKYNELPSGEIKEILLNWIDRKKLLIDTSDIQNNIDFIEGETNYG